MIVLVQLLSVWSQTHTVCKVIMHLYIHKTCTTKRGEQLHHTVTHLCMGGTQSSVCSSPLVDTILELSMPLQVTKKW